MIDKAVIAVAGHGTRMSPVSKIIAKELLPIGTTPVLDFIVDECVRSGVKNILFIINRSKVSIPLYFSGVEPEDYNLTGKTYTLLNRQGVSCAYVYQDKALGTGHAVKLAKKFVGDDPFGLLFGDDIIVSDVPGLKQLIDLSDKNNGAIVVAAKHMGAELASLYATIVSDDFNGSFGKITDIQEKVSPDKIKSDLTSIGRFVLNKNIFEHIDKIGLRNNEYYLTDALESVIKDENCFVLNVDGVRYDTGNPEGYAQTFKALCGY